jgi:hypothetical protein
MKMDLAHTTSPRPTVASLITASATHACIESSAQTTTHDAALSLSDIEMKVRITLGEQRAAPVLSDTRRVVRELLMAERRIDEATARALLATEDLRGPLLRAEEFARVQALRAKREAGATRLRQGDLNRIGRVAKVVAIVAPKSVVQRSRRPIEHVLPPAWRPVLESVSGTSVAAGAKRRHIEVLITAFARHGILSPCQLPTDGDYLGSLVDAEGVFKPKTISTALSDLRSALKQCIAVGTLPPDTPVPGKRLGAKRARGGKAWATDPDAKLRHELPLWAEDLEEYLIMSKDKLGGMTHSRRLATYRLAVGLCEMRDDGLLPGVELRTLQMQDLGTLQVSRPDGTVSSNISRAAARNGRRASTDTIPLVVALGEYLTRVVRRTKPGKGVPPIVYHDLSRVWGLCAALMRPDPQASLEDRVLWQSADELVRACLNDAEKSRPPEENERNKGLLAEHLSLPQTVVFGIPYYTLLELPAADAEVAAHPAGSRGRSDATERRTRAMYEWLALSTKFADPLRIQQRAFGRVGREIDVAASFDSSSGLLESITGVTSHFAGKLKHVVSWFGESNPDAGFKQHNKPPRDWDWSPSIVDFAWLARYFRDIWYPCAQTLGERGSMREAMASGRWTLFPTTAAGGTTTHPRKGMAGDWISERTGDAILRVLREALGYSHLPPLRKEAIQSGWRLLLSDHNARHLWATHWGGLRATRGPRQERADGTFVESISGMEHCQRATTDTAKSLTDNYVALTQTIQRLLTRTVGSWAHPLSLDAIMDRVTLTDRAVDWSAEWDRLAAVEGIDAMPPALRAWWVGVRVPSSRRRSRRGRSRPSTR